MNRRAAVAIALSAAAPWLACGLSVVGTGVSAVRADGGTSDPFGPNDAGDGGPRDDASEEAGPAPGLCGSRRGPLMITVGAYCVDATEVTQAEYQQFLDSRPAPGTGLCSWNADYQPTVSCSFSPTTTGRSPVVCVDWCDAAAYCAWAGKRLCGAIGGGKIVWNSAATVDAGVDQWTRACSAGGTRTYPYGATQDTQNCNVADHVPPLGGPVDVASLSGCVGGFPGLFDMSGNVFEWEDSCEDINGADDHCALRGGSYLKRLNEYGACNQVDQNNPRNGRFVDVGFRCCSSP